MNTIKAPWAAVTRAYERLARELANSGKGFEPHGKDHNRVLALLSQHGWTEEEFDRQHKLEIAFHDE